MTEHLERILQGVIEEHPAQGHKQKRTRRAQREPKHERDRRQSEPPPQRQISPERADAIALCFFSELTYAEAGLALKKSEAAIKMLVARGLQDLRERTSLAFEVEP